MIRILSVPLLEPGVAFVRNPKSPSWFIRVVDSPPVLVLKNNLPDCLKRWAERKGSEQKRSKTEQSFCISKDEIKKQGYDLSLNRYKEIVYEEVEHRPPLEILAELKELEAEISKGIDELEEMLK